MTLLFGTAGIPISAKATKTAGGITAVKELGLDALEIEFVRAIYLTEKSAKECKEIASKNNIILSIHAPYFINLNSENPEIVKKSQWFIYQSAKIGALAGAKCVVFHPGFYVKKTKEQAYFTIKKNLEEVVNKLKKENVAIHLCPETMGRISQFGTLDEILQLSVEMPNVRPCLDFAHIWARAKAELLSQQHPLDAVARESNILLSQNESNAVARESNSRPRTEARQMAESDEKAKDGRAFAIEILEKIKKVLGNGALKNLHIHMHGVEYNKNGEHNHKTLENSEFPWIEILQVLKENKVEGIIISESPNIELDAILMKKYYNDK